MRRRQFLHVGVASTLGLAGCLNRGTEGDATTSSQSATTTPASEDRRGVYIQSFVEGTYMAGMADADPYKVGLMYTVPHEFWNVNGTSLQKTAIDETDSVHVMATVWDPETGVVLGDGNSGAALFVATLLAGDEVPAGIDAENYLAVSARTPYNRFVLPAMALGGTLSRDGEEVYSGTFERTLDPDLNYHYGAGVSGVESGDTLTLTVETPLQVARHEGYETAFLDTEPFEIALSGQ